MKKPGKKYHFFLKHEIRIKTVYLVVLSITLLLFCTVFVFRFYKNKLYGQKTDNIFSDKEIDIGATPAVKKMQPLNTVINYSDSANWNSYTYDYQKNINYSYFYPDNLYVAKDLGGLPGIQYFFKDLSSKNSYLDCLSKKDEKGMPAKDWIHGCDLTKDLLFTVSVTEGKYQTLTEEFGSIDFGLSEYVSNTNTFWVVATKNVDKIGYGYLLMAETLPYNNQDIIRLSVRWLGGESQRLSKEITGMDNLDLFFHLLFNFSYKISIKS